MADHPLLADVVSLKQAKGMGPMGRLLLEGARQVQRAIDANVRFELVLHAPEYYSDDCAALVAALAKRGVETVRLEPKAFSKLSYKADGILALVRHVPPRIDQIRTDRILALDALGDPGNIGAAIRSANAWAVDAVVVVESGSRLYHPKSLRASMGALFVTPSLSLSRANAIELARTARLPVVALVPDATRSIVDALGDRWMIVIGHENRGVHADWLGPEAIRANIPMRGVVDSLNAATAAAVTLWEAFRRHSPTAG
ncbi:MAG: TrmH family RNA methyltransferase [Kofleriaceae bacterium]